MIYWILFKRRGNGSITQERSCKHEPVRSPGRPIIFPHIVLCGKCNGSVRGLVVFTGCNYQYHIYVFMFLNFSFVCLGLGYVLGVEWMSERVNELS